MPFTSELEQNNPSLCLTEAYLYLIDKFIYNFGHQKIADCQLCSAQFFSFRRLVSFFDGCLDFPLDVNEYFPIGKTHFSNLVHSLCVYRIRFACQSPAECITVYIKQTGCIILLKKASHSFCFLGGFVFAFSGLN